MERETIEYLDPQEQLRVAALVNRLCETTPEDFDEQIHIQDAQEIVKSLDPKIKPTKSNFSFSASHTSTSESSVMSGATDQGNVSTSFEETKKREVRIGKILDYRIGMYVAIRRDKKDRSNLYFQHFWDRGEISDAFEKEEPTTEIMYRKDNLELLAISRLVPKARNLGFLTVTTYQSLELWKADKA